MSEMDKKDGWSSVAIGPEDEAVEVDEDSIPRFDLTPETPPEPKAAAADRQASPSPRQAGTKPDREGEKTSGRASSPVQAGAQPVQFASFEPPASVRSVGNIDLLQDVPLPVTVELGRTTMLVKDILAMGPGAVIELDKAAGENVDILVNGRLIARGEVVVIEENFGVRIHEFVSGPLKGRDR